MRPTDELNLTEIKALGRKKIIEMAKAAAREAGSHMVPDDDRDVKVLVGKRDILVILSKGFRAYTDDGARVITSLELQVRYQDGSPTISYEGDDLMTDADRKVLDLVLKNMPPNYQYNDISITDDRAKEPDRYLVSIDNENTSGRHAVDKKTGEWTYITHKHYARTNEDDGNQYKELKD